MENLSEFALALVDFFSASYSLATTILMVITVGVVFGLVQLLKKPIKHFTSKIGNEDIRKLVNKSIILLSFAVSIGLWYLMNWVMPMVVQIDWIKIFLSGSMSVVAHALQDGLLNKTKVKEVIKDIEKVTEDGKIDSKDKSAIKEFLEKVK